MPRVGYPACHPNVHSIPVCSNGGSQAYGDMLRMRRDDHERFFDEYHQRSIIDAVFGASRCTETTYVAG